MEAFITLNMFKGSQMKRICFGVVMAGKPFRMQPLSGKKIPHKVGCQQAQVVVHFSGPVIKIVMCEIIQFVYKVNPGELKTFRLPVLLIL